MKLHASVISIATALGLCVPAGASLTYTFDADVEGFQNVTWQATAPVGWAGGAR